MNEQTAIADMVVALRKALADCPSGSECRRLLEESLQLIGSLGTNESSGTIARVAQARRAAQALRQASLQVCCQTQPSMENARRTMTIMLFAVVRKR